MTAQFEAQHPRHGNGRFRRKDERAEPVKISHPPREPAKQARSRKPAGRSHQLTGELRKMGDDDLAVAWVRMSAEPARPGLAESVAALDAELARREGRARLTVDNHAKARQVDDLVRRGRSFTDAYAEAHGLDPAKLDRQQRAGLVDAERRPGERREQTLRRMYAEHVYLQYLDAEDATRGNVLTREGRAKGIDPASLWSGQATRARRYASDELKSWWEGRGGRQTWAQFRAQYVGGGTARRAAEASRQAGAGRDFGV